MPKFIGYGFLTLACVLFSAMSSDAQWSPQPKHRVLGSNELLQTIVKKRIAFRIRSLQKESCADRSLVNQQELDKNFENRTVVCKLTVGSAGTAQEVSIYRSSGSETIDQKAINIVKTAAPFRRITPHITKAPIFIVELPILKVSYFDN
ncbi:MAG: energy transducer TonB [Leptolyngbya sp.]|nr:energy transducer TonB [Candidatus Melainabacteria bacterium]